MTVHMFRVYIGKGNMDIADLEARVSEWLGQSSRWDEDNITHELRELTSERDGAGEVYYTIAVRFLQTNTKGNLQQQFTGKIKDKVSWYRVVYHDCKRDDLHAGRCKWGDREDWPSSGDIPNYVPEINVDNG